MTTKTYVGDTGTVITAYCGAVDISAATARSIAVQKPDGTSTSWAAVASGTDSIAYTTDANSLDQAGTWRLQAVISLGGGTWRGKTATLEVYAAFR